MNDDKKQQRHDAISKSAYKILKEKGFSGASLLNIAKDAKASNETLYRWYGGKIGLFEAMIQSNAAEIKQRLETAIQADTDAIETLRATAPLLLAMVLGERAILLNRAAAADPTNQLGDAIARNGREVIAPLLAQTFSKLAQEHMADARDMSEAFINLLIGDLQIRRVIGAIEEPNMHVVRARAEVAINQFLALYR